jgi:hypothetical protein
MLSAHQAGGELAGLTGDLTPAGGCFGVLGFL